MGKIHKALEKVQAERAKTAKRESNKAASTEDSVIVAKVVLDSDGVRGPTQPTSSGKSVIVDTDALRTAGLVAPETDEKVIVRQYQEIKRPLIAHAFGRRATQVEDGNIIMVTSAIAGEGKTFNSINLALSMAQEKDHSVLLVDADVAKPHTSEIFGAENEIGILDLLEDPSLDPAVAVLDTNFPGLQILPAGTPRVGATELLASSRMEELLRALNDAATDRIILLDSPPLLQTSEAKVLASLVGQVVVVVKAEFTPQEATVSAVTALDQSKPINLVLNQARSGQSEQHYSYGVGRSEVGTGGRAATMATPETQKTMWG
tara:strand:- start:2038 stop:2994 length:957 start_codon:yes stop_codon:yes gene_type:complete